MVAVLFARRRTVYRSMGVDVYDIDRDARTYVGHAPVIAHPPCRAWGRLRTFAKPRPDEKALALFAVAQVRRCGGVLEHPANSLLWPAQGLPEPGARDTFGGWTLPVYQSWWGHRARKASRLYIVGVEPRDMPAMPLSLAYPTNTVENMGAAEREATPPEFAAWLIELASRCAHRATDMEPRTVYQGHTRWEIVDRQRARTTTVRVKREVRAQHKADTARALEIATIRADRERPVEPGMPDSAIRGLAKQRVEVMAERIVRLDEATTDDAMREWLCSQVESLGAAPFPPFHGKTDRALQLAGMLARATSVRWWRRHLRRTVVAMRERLALERGEVHSRGQIYCTDDTVARRIEQNQRNAETLAATEIEDEAGQVITLAQAAGAGVANRGIRRKELMTRIRGCEEWAEANGMAGLFTTNTLPSRFHKMQHGGGRNPKWDGSGPRDGQGWLCAAWARARAQLHHAGIPFFGFRVAEPHHDMTPHWHMLLWTAPEYRNELRRIIRAQWLRDEGDEPGAKRHRFSGKKMRAGGAAGYIAKYIAKNIDDAAMPVEGGADDWSHTKDLFGGNVAKRVEAWAAAHRIRQFQAIGQPPVTVWRELRRIEAATVLVAPDAVRMAHHAVHRDGERLADWRGYMDAQGGAMTGRDYRVRMLTVEVSGEGRYEPVTQKKPVGVYAASEPTRHYRSERREWRPRGAWAAPMTSPPANPHPVYLLQGGGFVPNPAHERWITEAPQREAEQRAQRAPRTRLNNCTGQGGAADLLPALIARNMGVPGGHLKENPCSISSSPPPRPPKTPLPRSSAASNPSPTV